MYPESIVLRPAYGRKYATAQEAIKDWEAGKDFKMFNGRYCSIRDKKDLLKYFGSYILLAYGSYMFITVASVFRED